MATSAAQMQEALVDSALREQLIAHLMLSFASCGFEVRAARAAGYPLPPVVRNTRLMGDRKDKQSDLYGYDPSEQVAVRGLVKASNAELRSEHTSTQLRLFASQTSLDSSKPSRTYIIVPIARREDLTEVLGKLNLADKPHVIPLVAPDR